MNELVELGYVVVETKGYMTSPNLEDIGDPSLTRTM